MNPGLPDFLVLFKKPACIAGLWEKQ